MKNIDLAKPFETLAATLLSLPLTEPAFSNGTALFEEEQMQELLRSIYEAANGRQVATTIGLISIAPAVASYLAKEPFYVETQADFLSQILGRVAKQISNKRTPARPSRRLGARAVDFQPNTRHSRYAETGPSPNQSKISLRNTEARI
jgi:hypothetical protein